MQESTKTTTFNVTNKNKPDKLMCHFELREYEICMKLYMNDHIPSCESKTNALIDCYKLDNKINKKKISNAS
jgi:hypothetical protein